MQSTASKPTILIVEDNPAIMDWLARGLELYGYDTVQAFDRDEGASVIGNILIDVALVNIIMQGSIDVVTLINKLRQVNIPVLVISAESQQVIDSTVQQTGAEGSFRKPFKIADLVPVIAGILGSKP